MSDATVFVTSDHHFGHANIIRYCNRPFASVEEMDRELIRRWNMVVAEDDVVYYVGDFMLDTKMRKCDDVLRRTETLLSLLNGTKHLVFGNHDNRGQRQAFGWASVCKCVVLRLPGMPLVLLNHYPATHWSGKSTGTVLLHGHCHGQSRPMRGRFDVGVDVRGSAYAPWTLEEAVRLAQRGA